MNIKKKTNAANQNAAFKYVFLFSCQILIKIIILC